MRRLHVAGGDVLRIGPSAGEPWPESARRRLREGLQGVRVEMVTVTRIHYLSRRCPEILKAVGAVYFPKAAMHSVFGIAAVTANRSVILHI